MGVLSSPSDWLVAQGFDLKVSYETGHIGAVIIHLDLLLYRFIIQLLEVRVLQHLIYGTKGFRNNNNPQWADDTEQLGDK